MTAEQLSAIFGVLVSLAASYIPRFAAWFAAFDPTKKRLLMPIL